jgi:hypothetical protein
MANCKLLLNDGTSYLLLNDGVSKLLLNDNSCADVVVFPAWLSLLRTVFEAAENRVVVSDVEARSVLVDDEDSWRKGKCLIAKLTILPPVTRRNLPTRFMQVVEAWTLVSQRSCHLRAITHHHRPTTRLADIEAQRHAATVHGLAD